MAERTSSLKPVDRSRPAGSEEQLWPIVCATMALVGILGVIVVANSDFDEDRLYLNGYTYLAGLGVVAALLIFIASRLKGAARRTAELAIVLSLALHSAAGVGAFYLFKSDLGGSSLLDAARDARPESDDDSPLPDYHWAQDEEQQPEQAFEKVVETTVRDQAPAAAQVQPRDMEHVAPLAEVPRAPKVEVTPLGTGATEPSGPLDIRPDAAKVEEAKPPEALAMVRQKEAELPIPKTESPTPADHEYTVPEAAKEAPKTPEPAALKAEKIDWASVARQGATPNNELLPPPRKMARVEVQPNESLPSANIVARLPSQAPPQTSNSLAGAEAANQITQQGSTLERSNRDGLPLPSTVVPDAGLPAQSPADREYTVPGSSPPSRLEAVSTVPVEKSDTSRAPLGPTIASNGNQDLGDRVHASSHAAGRHQWSRQGYAFVRRRLVGGSCGSPLRVAPVESQQRPGPAFGASPAGDRIATGRRRFRSQCQPVGPLAADPIRDGLGPSRVRQDRRELHILRGGRNRVQSRWTDQ